MTDNQNFNPNISWGGTWVQLDGGYALTTTKADATDGYQNLTTRADNHTPGQNMQGGLPNIVGSISAGGETAGIMIRSNINNNYVIDGAFYGAQHGNITYSSGNLDGRPYNIDFDANRCADNYGLYQSKKVSVIADHHATIVWKRTA